jgi:hypothetical protein
VLHQGRLIDNAALTIEHVCQLVERSKAGRLVRLA